MMTSYKLTLLVIVNRSKLIVAIAAGMLLLVSCGGGGSDGGTKIEQDTSSIVVRLEVQNTDLLLTEAGQKSKLIAKGFNATGMEVPIGVVVWQSDSPSNIIVDDKGVMTALVENGSAQITVTKANVTSRAALATVAQKTLGTIILPDNALSGIPVLIDSSSIFEVGTKFKVSLASSVPPIKIGDILVATGINPFIARVIAAGQIDKELVLETVSPFIAFPKLTLKATSAVSVSDMVFDTGISDAFDIKISAENEITFDLKPGKSFTFESKKSILSTNKSQIQAASPLGTSCKLESGAKLELANLKFKQNFKNIKVTTNLALGEFIALVEGPYIVDLLAVPALTIPAGGSAECSLTFGYLPAKLIGPLAWLLGTEVPVGVKLKLEAQGAEFKTKLEAGYSMSGLIKVGVDCSKSICSFPHELSGDTSKSVFKPSYDVAPFKLGYNVGLYGFMKVRASPAVDWIKGPKILITTSQLGIEIGANTAPPPVQAAFEASIARYEAKITTRISSSDELEITDNAKLAEFFKKWFSVNLAGYEYTYEISKKDSPKGKVTIPKRPLKAGDQFTIQIALDPTSVELPGFGYVLDSIVLFLQNKDGIFSDFAIRSVPISTGSNIDIDIVATPAMIGGKIFAFVYPKYKFFLGSPGEIGSVDLGVSVTPIVTAGSCTTNNTPIGKAVLISSSFAGSGTVTGDIDGQFGIFATTSGPEIDPAVGFDAGPNIKSMSCGTWTSTADSVGRPICRRDAGQPEKTSWSFNGGPTSPVSRLYYYPVVGTSIKNPGFPVNCV